MPPDRLTCFNIVVDFGFFGVAFSSLTLFDRAQSLRPFRCCDNISTDFERRFNRQPNGVRGLSISSILVNRLPGVNSEAMFVISSVKISDLLAFLVCFFRSIVFSWLFDVDIGVLLNADALLRLLFETRFTTGEMFSSFMSMLLSFGLPAVVVGV